MCNYLVGMAVTGDGSKPWLIAVCMIVSIVGVFALFLLGQGDKDEEDDDDMEE
ncbi:MAG: hypothetical protein J6A03_12030 [Lachnospiraceae bacterium]|nr:hypothetical protein [Lachnospiraceae bacterium]